MTITCPSCEASYRIGPDALGAGREVRCARCKTRWFAEPVETTAAARGPDGTEPIRSLDEAAEIDAVESLEGGSQQSDLALDAVILPNPDAAIERRWFARRDRRLAASPPPKAHGKAHGKARAKQNSLIRDLKRLRPVVLTAAIGIPLCGFLIGQRVAVVRQAPSLASLYAAVGLPVNVRGLSIGGLKSVEHIEEGVPLLLVTGEVENVSAFALDVPRLRLAVMSGPATSGEESELYAWTTVAARAKLAPGETASFRARLASPPADGSGIAVRFVARQDLVTSASR